VKYQKHLLKNGIAFLYTGTGINNTFIRSGVFFFKILIYILMLSRKSGLISGIRPAPDIRFLAFRFAGYVADTDIWQNQYLVYI
jgi:hypothetical protein